MDAGQAGRRAFSGTCSYKATAGPLDEKAEALGHEAKATGLAALWRAIRLPDRTIAHSRRSAHSDARVVAAAWAAVCRSRKGIHSVSLVIAMDLHGRIVE